MALWMAGAGTAAAQNGTKPLGPGTVTVKARINDGPWTTSAAIYPLKGEKVTLTVDKVPGATTKWYQIIPDISKIYKNCNHPWEPDPYKWVGLAKIEYSRKERTDWRGKCEVEPLAPAPDTQPHRSVLDALKAVLGSNNSTQHSYKDVGSFWFQVEVEKNGRTQRSPGIEDSDKKGLSPRVFRISVREGDGFLGYVTSFLNVPGVFGSVPYQSNNYIGIDCCDVVVAAYGKWKNRTITKDYNVDMLVTKLPRLAEFDLESGRPDKTLRWGKDVRPGNLIAVKFKGAKRYQHIGALYGDADKDGVLSRDDLVIHAGPLPLHHSYLREGGFDGHIMVLDPQFSRLLSGADERLQLSGHALNIFR